MFKNFLFGGVKLTKYADPNKYSYSRYGISFDVRVTFFGKNVIIFGGDMSSSAHIDNSIKDILILGKSLTQGLDDTTLTAEAE